MNISPNIARHNYNSQIDQTSFKGHFAAPIKSVVFQPAKRLQNENYLKYPINDFIREFYKKTKGLFDTLVQCDRGVVKNAGVLDISKDMINKNWRTGWKQDYTHYHDDGSISSLHLIAEGLNNKLAKFHNTKAEKLDGLFCTSHFPGGNYFIGKNDKKERIMLLGKDALESLSKEQIAKNFKVKPDNLHFISQPDYHLDLAIRPVNYPYVLVGDAKMTAGELEKFKGKVKGLDSFITVHQKAREDYIGGKEVKKWIPLSDDDFPPHPPPKYADTDLIVEELISEGFEPIRVPGLFGKNKINYMNAIAHQEKNGDIKLIVPENKPFKEMGIDTDRIFELAVKKDAPQVKEVVFIDDVPDFEDGTFIANNLENSGAGMHCLLAEKVDYNA